MSDRPVFIVSSGRCGSTLLSNMVHLHPDLLSVSEFFTAMSSKALRGHMVTGETVRRRLHTLSPAGKSLLKNHLDMDEFLYPLGPDARYDRGNVPPILCTALPHLSDDHENIWDALSADLQARGTAPLADHYRFIFEWLAARFGCKLWFERSGGSLCHAARLIKMFPDARFVHIFRDGRDTALSMENHVYFRLRADMARRMGAIGIDPFRPFNAPGTSPWIPMLERLKFRRYTAENYHRMKIPQDAFGALWSRMIEVGMKALDGLPPDRLLSMRYEDLLAAPRAEMTRFIRFVGPEFENEDWLRVVSTMPKSDKMPSRARLSCDALARLTKACMPGMTLLEYDIEAADAALMPGAKSPEGQ